MFFFLALNCQRQFRAFAFANVGMRTEQTDRDLPQPICFRSASVFVQILNPDDIPMRFAWADPAWDDAVLQHPCRFPFADVKDQPDLFQGYFRFLQ